MRHFTINQKPQATVGKVQILERTYRDNGEVDYVLKRKGLYLHKYNNGTIEYITSNSFTTAIELAHKYNK